MSFLPFRRRTVVLAAVFLVGAATAALPQTKLPAFDRKWLEEEVVYIITPLEREVFLKLQTDRERSLFRDAFWKHRDPVPVTPENEFKTEHFRRIAYADKYFGRTSPRPGWTTDRGRIYIILGEPGDIQRFNGKSGIFDAEVWFYQEKGASLGRGLPAGFNLVFYQEGNQGDFRLYSPIKDGPRALLQGYIGDPLDFVKAYQALRDIDPALAAVSLSLIPGENAGTLGRPSLASDLLIQKVENASRDLVDEKYASKFLEFKDIVEVEYSANYLDSDGSFAVIRDSSGLFFVHYAIEPRRLSVEAVGDEYATTIRINGVVSAPDGRRVYQFEKTVRVRFDESRKRELDRSPFVIHDLFPLIPGKYKVSLLLKNEASKEFCSLDRTLVVPEDAPGIRMTVPLLGYRTQPAAAGRRSLKPFQYGSTQVYFQPGRVFTRADQLVLAFQVFGFVESPGSRTRVRFTITRDGNPVKDWERDVGAYPEKPNVLESISADGFPPAHYVVKIALVVDGHEVAGAADEFDLSHQETIPRPWIHSKLMPEAGDPSYDGILGQQYEAVGRSAEAKVLLEKARSRLASSSEIALALARVYAEAGNFAAVVPLLDPFLTQTPPPAYDLWISAAAAHLKIGDFAPGIDIIDRAISGFGANTTLLNLLGDGYFGLKRPDEARAAWDKSLRMNANQPEIRKKIEAIKSVF